MDLLDDLNPAQRAAVEILEGPALVLAGPGSGKTRVLTYRIAYLVKECSIDPYNVMAVTFTNKAAREMRGRLERLIGEQRLRRLTIGTFHAICARLLRRESQAINSGPEGSGPKGLPSNFVIYDRDDQLSLIRQALRELDLDDKMYRPVAIQGTISKAKRSLLAPGEYDPPTYWHEVAARVYDRYQQLLRANSALDFDDLLMLAVRLLREHEETLQKYQRRYLHVLVDEFQDTDSAQYRLVQMLTAMRKNLFVVGDEDQSIYGWRGADFRNIRRFRRDFAEAQVVLLEQNYRSTQNILDAARHVISLNSWRTKKRLWTKNPRGLPITVFEAYDEQEEAEYVVREIEKLVAAGICGLNDCAVMYRTNAQSRVLEDAFVRHSLPYKLVGATRFYERREIRDMVAYMRLIYNPYDNVSLQRILNVPPRGIGAKTRKKLEDWAQLHGVPLYTALQLLEEGKQGAPSAQTADEPVAVGRHSVPDLDERGSKALLAFLSMVDSWIAARDSDTVLELMDRVLADSAYAEYVRDGTEEGEERWENIQELRSVAQDYAELPSDSALTAFLEMVALVSDVDNLREEVNAATLLTLHTAKGLEFDSVFITGLEEGILPHSRSREEPEEMEEERRLCYVGMTRARRGLYLVHTFRRTRFGSQSLSQPSRFLRDIPGHLTTGAADRAPARERMGAKVAASTRVERRHSSFAPGDRVQHPRFGEGIVVNSQGRGGDEELIVAFAGKVGIKRLLASFAGLKRLSRPE
jgi:DNA helicase-2/ATP-dependent DNA helicase PcrA